MTIGRMNMHNIKKLTGWQLILVFMLLAIIFLTPQLLKQTMYINSWDVPFHLSRVYEITKGFENGQWLPDVSAYTFGENGYGVNFFYGYSFTYLVSLIYFLTHQAVTAVLVSYVILLTLAMSINYYAGSLFFKGVYARLKSVVFSILYVLAPVTFGEIKVRGLPGELIGILLFPAVVAAFYSIMFTENRKSWIFAGLVTAITVTNHVLSTLLLIIILVVMFVIFLYQKQISRAKISQLIKAGILSLLLSAFYIVPLAQHLLMDHVAGANKIWGTVSIWDSVAASLNNQATLNWTVIPVGVFVFIMSIVVLLGLLYLKSFSNQMKRIGGWLGVSIVIIFYTPTDILMRTPLHVFQMMGRFYPIIMMLAVLFVVEGLVHFYEIGLLRFKTLNLVFGVGILLALLSAWRMQATTYYTANNDIANYQKNNRPFPKTVSNKNFVYQITHYYQLPLGSKDYLGKERVRFVNGYQFASWGDTKDATQIYVNGKLSSLKLTHQGYTFNVENLPTSAAQVRLPMTNYEGWQATGSHGQNLPIETVKGKLAVTPQGSRTIKLKYHKTLYHRLAIWVSGLTLVGMLLGSLVVRIKNKRN